MSRRTQENLIAIAFLLVFLGAIALSLEFGPRARMIPLPLASFGAILALVQLVWQNIGSTDALKMDMIEVEQPKGLPVREPDPRTQDRQPPQGEPTLARRAGAYAIVLALVAMVLAFGPIPAVFVFTLGYFVATRYCAPLPALVYTILFTGALYLLFFVLLEVTPYHGLLAPIMAYFD